MSPIQRNLKAEALKQLRREGTIDCVLYMELKGAGMCPEKIMEDFNNE